VGSRRWSLTPLVLKSKMGEGSRQGTDIVRGKRRRLGGVSLRLLTRMGGQRTVASGVAALAGGAAARLHKEEDDRRAGQNRAKSQVGWARWAEKETGPVANKIKENENKMVGLQGVVGRKRFWAAKRK
jgi:hypothetical protein